MSGIVGALGRNGHTPDERDLLRMAQAIHHRGGDGVDVVRKGELAMALARLGRPTLAVRGPLAASGPAYLVLDGELSDRAPCERVLARRGRISLGTDAEVLLDALEVGGTDLLAELDGAFAFAAWWPGKQRLLLARDRFGARPLYFTWTPEALLFASEMKALLTHPGTQRRLDPKGLDQVLTFWSTVAPRTIIEGMEELPPGFFLDLNGRSLAVRRYWRLDLGGPALPGDTEGAAAWLMREIDGAVRRRVGREGKPGAYISGGVDSTILAYVARGLMKGPLSTFSVSFSAPDYDESLEQRRVVKHIGSNHRALSCSLLEVAQVFPEVTRHVETPLVRTAPAPLFLLGRLAKEAGVKAILTGEGADELFGGYDIFKEVKVRRFCAAAPSSRVRPELFRRLYHYQPALQAMPSSILSTFFGARPDQLADPFFSHRPRWNLTASIKRLYHPDIKAALAGYDPIEELSGRMPPDFDLWDPFCRAQYLEATILLPALLAVQGDRVAMASGLATRTPFLDRRVVSVAMSLPVSLKMRGLREKYLLRKAVASFVPDELRMRAKQPYRAPQSACFLAPDGGADPAWVQEILSEDRIRRDGVFQPTSVSRLVNKLRGDPAPSVRDEMAFVAVVSTGLVLDQFVTSFGRWFNA